MLFGPSGSGKTTTLNASPGWCAPTPARSPSTAAASSASAGAGRPCRPGGAARLRLPAVRALPPPDGRPEHRLRPMAPGRRRRRAAWPGAARDRPPGRPLSARAVRRPAAAGGHRARAGHGAAGAAARRAVLGAGRGRAPRAARRAAQRSSPSWGIAAVLVTHDLTEAYRLGDRIVVYEEGRVIQAAPTRGAPVAAAPRSAVARIMGMRESGAGAPCSRPRPTASSSAGAGRCWRRSTRRPAPTCPRRTAPSRSSSARSTCA